MKRFVFRLESALRLRVWKEEEAERALGEARRSLETLKISLEELRNELESWMNAPESQSPNPEIRLPLHLYLKDLAVRTTQSEVKVHQAELGVQSALAQLLEASKDRKALESLKEKRILEHRHARLRFAAVELDERAADMLRRRALDSAA